MFETAKKILAWIPVDSYLDLGPGRLQSQDSQELSYVLSKCMTCGCCLEACPSMSRSNWSGGRARRTSSSTGREKDAFRRSFMGAFALSLIDLFNSNPIGQMNSQQRLDALVAEGGVQVCGNAQNCVQVCPQGNPPHHLDCPRRPRRHAPCAAQWFDR